MWREIKEGVSKATIRKEIVIKEKRIGEKSWDRQCSREKKEVKKALKL